MPHFDIVRQSQPVKSFRVASVMGTYDLQTEHISERFVGDIDLPDSWNVGLIVGRSGTGKTTIATELFGEKIYRGGQNYTHECLLDDFPQDVAMSDIYQALTSVGFASAPDWLKSYDVLSNGEKMRCDIARAMLENDDMFVFDEFTSVVDRDIAKVASFAIQKAIRRRNQKFIAVTCHHDVQEWLMPDWVFNTDDMTFRLLDVESQKKNRPALRLEIYETKRKEYYWSIFSKYHYLSANFHVAARTYICTCNGKIAALCAVLPFPHPTVKNTWREHRSVVLPDFQGVGIGTAFTDYVAGLFQKEGKTFISTTSNPAMIATRRKSKKWKCLKIGRHRSGSGKLHNKRKKESGSSSRITASFEFVGER